ncbi:MAG: thioredoxin [Lachnospiraceae bacterium]|jgi:thioredoxin 1|nr:thioredoxin [Roseburia sp.]MEE0375284.1 thioredoxin [Lachnospiraceae bacterium]OLA57923.1 MAG: thioredoxin [Roseburia sp. CAG:10041_57]CDF44297.1 thioredoxin [Roseburia sp. CAG:100]MCI5610191.1 thioredoxin [Roseburia sp.]
MVHKIEQNNMQDALKAKVAVVDFSATWCGPCKMLAPIMEELSEEMAGQVEFYNADTDENMDLALANKVTSIPALFLLRDGQIVDRMIGFQSKQALKNWIGGTQ